MTNKEILLNLASEITEKECKSVLDLIKSSFSENQNQYQYLKLKSGQKVS
jgi:hypothetical protein